MPEPGLTIRGNLACGVLGYSHMKNFLNSFLRDESGASAAEYALILVVVGLAIVAGGFALSNAIGTAMTNAASCIAEPGTFAAPDASCS
jgi:pilus assembly protein Flp/PilA